MITSFDIKHFRTIEQLTIEPLDRVNLITGKNTTGKTTVLEALFLHLGPSNPGLSLTVASLRGIDRIDIEPDEVWGALFSGWETTQPIVLSNSVDAEPSWSVTIELIKPKSEEMMPSGIGAGNGHGMKGSATSISRNKELVFTYKDSRRLETASYVRLSSEGHVQMTRADIVSVPGGVFLSTRHRFPNEDAQRFSRLEAVGKQDDLLPALQILEPRLRRLALVLSGGIPLVHGDIGIGRLVPILLMGEGIERVLSILLAVADTRLDFVLVDEIENGLHYSTLQAVWRALGLAARQFDVQLFATTHSWECIEAAHRAFDAMDKYDFRLYRLDRVNGKVACTTYDRETLGAAIESGIEVR